MAELKLPAYRLPLPDARLPLPRTPFPLHIGPIIPGGVEGKLISMDTRLTLLFSQVSYARVPFRNSRHGGARWNEAGVAQASPQFLEYLQTNPNVWTFNCMFNAYNNAGGGGVANDFEYEFGVLDELKNRVPGKRRAHKLLWVKGKERFRCVLEDYEVPVERWSAAGGAMQSYDVTIVLKQLPR